MGTLVGHAAVGWRWSRWVCRWYSGRRVLRPLKERYVNASSFFLATLAALPAPLDQRRPLPFSPGGPDGADGLAGI